MRAPTPRRLIGSNPLASAMTPMIDVVFLLLVFFLCTASFERPEENLAASLRIESSTAGSEAIDEPPPELEDITITGKHAAGTTTWTLNEGRSTSDLTELTALLDQLATIDTSLPVTIDPSDGVPLSDVVGAYDAARSAGFARVLMTADAASEVSP